MPGNQIAHVIRGSAIREGCHGKAIEPKAFWVEMFCRLERQNPTKTPARHALMTVGEREQL